MAVLDRVYDPFGVLGISLPLKTREDEIDLKAGRIQKTELREFPCAHCACLQRKNTL